MQCRHSTHIVAAALVTAIGAFLPAVAEAQDAGPRTPSVEPYAGVILDAYDIGADNSRVGGILGVRAGYGRTAMRVVGNLAYGWADDVARPNTPSYFVYNNRWILATGGVEFGTVLYKRTSVAFAVEAGAAWRRTVRDGQVGAPADDGFGSDDWSAIDVVVPSFTAGYPLGARTAVTLGLRAHVFDVLEGGSEITPALTLGLLFR